MPSRSADSSFNSLLAVLQPYVVNHLQARFGPRDWERRVLSRSSGRPAAACPAHEITWDISLVFNVILLFWDDVFCHGLPSETRILVQELREYSYRLSQGRPFTADNLDRVERGTTRLLHSAGLDLPPGSHLGGGMQTIGVFNTRGGCGKSSLTMFLADFLSTVHHQRVLIVDLDPQKASSEILVGHDVVHERFAIGASLPLLLQEAAKDNVSRDIVRSFFIERPVADVRSPQALRSVQMLACDRQDWWAISDSLTRATQKKRRQAYSLLAETLQHVAHDFDVCLIDFPANDVGPLAQCGLHAMDWWLLTCVPNWSGVRDLEGAAAPIYEAHRNGQGLRPLGTVLNMCADRGTNEYRMAVNLIEQLEARAAVPPLFRRPAEISHRTEALNATGFCAHEFKTMAQKYGSPRRPFYMEVNAVAREVMHRLGLPVSAAAHLTPLENPNGLVSDLLNIG